MQVVCKNARIALTVGIIGMTHKRSFINVITSWDVLFFLHKEGLVNNKFAEAKTNTVYT
jgi:hypothetical protein